MSIPPIAQQAIDVFTKTEKTRSDIAAALLSKQMNVEKQQGQAAVKLIEQASTVSRGIDVSA